MNASLGAAVVDILFYDQLPPKTRQAFREANCPIAAKDTFEWMRRSDISDDQAAAFIRSLDAKGRAQHWAIMKGAQNGLRGATRSKNGYG